jgi:acetyltransferase
MNSLDPFFQPHSIAIVGASRDPRKLGSVILANLLKAGFPGEVIPVNPSGEEVFGRRAFKATADLPGHVDLAVIVVPAVAVPEVIDGCVARGVTAAIIVTAGFKELGDDGAVRERELVERARAGGMRLIGPNSVGIINTHAALNATFAQTQPLQHDVALISQSGAVATAILDWARSIGVGFSKFVSLGNAADVTESELIDYLASDAESNVLVVYLEGFSDGRRFMNACRRVTATKPVICMKVGRSEAGARAAKSHTGSIASADAVVDAAFRQVGVVRAYTLDELFDLTLVFSCAPLPAGPRVAVITNAGGPGVMAADEIVRTGLELAGLAGTSVEALAGHLPLAASLRNPVDLLGDARASRYERAIDIALRDPNVDSIVVMLTPQAVTEPEETAQCLAAMALGQSKPVVAVFMGGDAVSSGRLLLDNARVPAFAYPERAVRSLASLWHYARFRESL